jgi:hypothetical protein
MADIQSIREKARRTLHNAMKRPASYYQDPTIDSAPILVNVRPHGKRNQTGDLAGTNLSYAQNQDRVFTVLFFREEVAIPKRGALIVLSATEGYFVDNVELPDGLTVTASVTVADAADLAGRILPSGAISDSTNTGLWTKEEW